MCYEEEQELLKLVKANNIMLKQIIEYINMSNDDIKDFMINVFANVISNNYR